MYNAREKVTVSDQQSASSSPMLSYPRFDLSNMQR